MDEAQREALESSLIKFEQTKYDDRIKLIKKMHEEEVAEIRRVNREHEEKLEQEITSCRREREQLWIQAKEEARAEEKRKRAKF